MTIIILPINVTWRTALLRKAMRIGGVLFNLRRILTEQASRIVQLTISPSSDRLHVVFSEIRRKTACFITLEHVIIPLEQSSR